MSKKLTYKYVKEQIEKEGYELLSNEYINNSTNLDIKCPEGHMYSVRYNNFKYGRRCPYCSNEKINGHNIKYTYKYVKEQIEKEGYELLSNEYINAFGKLKVKCPEGHIYKVIWSNFQKGRRCPICYGNKKLEYNQVKSLIESVKGYNLLSKKYINNSTKISIRCPEGHIYDVVLNSFRSGSRCPICMMKYKTSKGEKEVLKCVKSFTNEPVIQNDRTQIINPSTGRNLELDIWIPSLNKAIEYNGEYWHSFEDRKQCDIEKIKQCKENAIDLLIITDKDWNNNKENTLIKIEEFIND